MTAKLDTVTTTIPTTAIDQSFSVTGFGTPVAAIFICSLGTTNGTEAVNAALSIGWCDGSRHRNHSVFSEDGPTRTDGFTYNSSAGDSDANDWVVTIMDGTGAVAAQAKWKQWDANGVTITWTTVTGTALRIDCTLVGGDAQAYAGNFTAPGSGGTAITAPNFPPDVVLFAGCTTFSSTPSSAASAFFSFGGSTRWPAIANAGGAWTVVDNQTPAVVCSYVHTISGPKVETNGLAENGNSVSAYSDVGFTVVDAIGGVGVPQMYLALRLPGLVAHADVENSPAGTGNTDHVLSALFPLHVFSADTLCAAVGTVESDDDASSIGVGTTSLTSLITSGCTAIRTRDAASSPASDSGSLHDLKAVHLYTGTSGTDAIVATITAQLPNGYRRNYSTAKAAKFASIVIGYQNVVHNLYDANLDLRSPEVVAY